MTTQIGTFIPLNTQNNNFGQNIGLGIAGFNPSITLNPNTVWGQNSLWNQNHAHNQGQASIVISPSVGYPYGGNFGDFTQGILSNGSTVAFVPQQGIASGTTVVGVPTNTSLQSLASGTAVVGIPSTFIGGNQTVNGISQSFATEVSENNQEYVLSFDVPGIDIQDLDVSLNGNTIQINGIRKNSQESTTLAYSEIARGSISRAIAVPFDVSPSKAINTSLENGVLKIRIAKENQTGGRTSARKVKIG